MNKALTEDQINEVFEALRTTNATSRLSILEPERDLAEVLYDSRRYRFDIGFNASMPER